MNVAVLGASGFVGTSLAQALRDRGDDVASLSLRDPASAAAAAACCDAIVNLAGEPIAQRWSASAKRRIFESRTELPKRFLEALAQRDHRVKTYVSVSAIGYYGTSESATFVEDSPPGDDFLARVCAASESQAWRAQEFGMRVGIVRSGIVLGAGGGALAKMLPAFRAGLGGIVGSGRQWVSWVHIDDLVGILRMSIDGAQGVLNATSPNPVTNAELTHTLAGLLHRPALVPVPTVALRILLGEGADVLRSGQRVLPRRTLELGYRFLFPELKLALEHLLRSR